MPEAFGLRKEVQRSPGELADAIARVLAPATAGVSVANRRPGGPASDAAAALLFDSRFALELTNIGHDVGDVLVAESFLWRHRPESPMVLGDAD